MRDAEVWKAIPGYEGLYEVSDLGHVRSLRLSEQPHELRPALTEGYPRVCLYKNGVSSNRHVHRLILEAFVGPCPINCQAAHLDGNRANSILSNLKWVTQKENEAHKRIHGTARFGEKANGSRLKESDIPEIKRLFNDGLWFAEIARRYKVNSSAIERVIHGRTWKHLSTEAALARFEEG